MSRISSGMELDIVLGELSEADGFDEGSGIRRGQPRVGGRGAAARGQTERRDQCDEQCSPDQRRAPHRASSLLCHFGVELAVAPKRTTFTPVRRPPSSSVTGQGVGDPSGSAQRTPERGVQK
jgi:hypothetical protein